MPNFEGRADFFNPAREAFISSLGDEFVLAQVLIRREKKRFELRHADDRGIAGEKLRDLEEKEIRGIAQFTSDGQFRPLKSAPNLQRGWRFTAGSEDLLESALDRLYPGALADWFAAQLPKPAVTPYREFTARQTGMYRITAMLDDLQAARMTKICCHPDFCLKRRLWTVPGQPPDAAEAKSLIPCLEPCAVLLEFARKVMRIEQEKSRAVESTMKDGAASVAIPTVETAVEAGGVREADFDSPLNPRRRRLESERLEIPSEPADGGEAH